MAIHIRRMTDNDTEELVDLSLAAFEPVYRSFAQVLGEAIYTRIYPDWRADQRAQVEEICRDTEHNRVWVADVDGTIAGYVAYVSNSHTKMGEVLILAVHPAFQRQGIGTELNTVALTRMRDEGMSIVHVATGGDPGHAPARASYEKIGYTPLPSVHYYVLLEDQERSST